MMCKKLICFVIVLSIVAPAMSLTRIFDNDSADGLWATATNWDPNDKRPALTEDVNIPSPFTVTSNDPNHGCTVLSVFDGATLNITGGTLAATNWALNGDLNMSGDATVPLAVWPAWGVDPNVDVNVTMSGTSYFYTGNPSRMCRGADSSLNVTLSGNAHYGGHHRYEMGWGPNTTVNVTVNDDAILGKMNAPSRWMIGRNGANGNATVTMNDNSIGYTDHLMIGYATNITATLNMNDNCYIRAMSGVGLYHLCFGVAGFSGQNATLNQNGGDIDIAASIYMPHFSTGGTSTYNLFAGTAECGLAPSGGELVMGENSLLNVKLGTLTVPGDKRTQLQNYEGEGKIKAYYGDYGERAKLYFTYNAGTDKTTISGYRPALNQAWGEVPIDGRRFAGLTRNTAAVTWQAGDDATGHEVFFGAVKADVEAETTGNIYGYYRGTKALGSESYIPGGDVTLNLGDTWYWRIDETQTSGPDVKGDVWELNVDNFMILDDMEAYDQNDSTPIGNVWTVTNGTLGVGYTYLARDDSSMEVVGNAGGVTTVKRTVPIADLTAGAQVNHLRIYFKGATYNTAQLLSVTLKDAEAVPNSHTVVYDGSANDIIDSRLDPWKEWAIWLKDFSDNGVVTTNVDEITISCGNNTNKTYIDDIVVYPTACIPAKARATGDVDGDCTPTLADFAILAYEFLETGITTVADNMESYADTAALRANYYPDPLDAPVGSVITLLTAGAFEGSKACQVDYDMWSDTEGSTHFSWTLIDLPDVDLSTGTYKELRVRRRNYVGNDLAAGVWIKLFNDAIGGGSSTNVAAHMQISNMNEYPGAWEESRVIFSQLWWYGSDAADPNPLKDKNHGYNSLADVNNCVGIYIDSWSSAASLGTYDIDYIRWMTPLPQADFEPDNDCDTDDLKTMGTNWLQTDLYPP